MKLDNEGHQIYLWKLIARLKFQEYDEYEFRQFVQSPFGTEILKELMANSTNKSIPKNIGLVDEKILQLILKRVEDWEESSKETARHWTDSQTKDYLISMIEPYNFTEEIISRLTTEFKERLEKRPKYYKEQTSDKN